VRADGGAIGVRHATGLVNKYADDNRAASAPARRLDVYEFNSALNGGALGNNTYAVFD